MECISRKNDHWEPSSMIIPDNHKMAQNVSDSPSPWYNSAWTMPSPLAMGFSGDWGTMAVQRGLFWGFLPRNRFKRIWKRQVSMWLSWRLDVRLEMTTWCISKSPTAIWWLHSFHCGYKCLWLQACCWVCGRQGWTTSEHHFQSSIFLFNRIRLITEVEHKAVDAAGWVTCREAAM